jgi:exodeoxyribonuclease VII small subunit
VSPKPEDAARPDEADSAGDPHHTPPATDQRREKSGRERSASASSFEAAFGELQRVVDQLEGGGLDLEHAVRLFDRGTALAQSCERIIDDAELRVTRLTAESASALSDASPQET